METSTAEENRPLTATRILDAAQALVQQRGYNAVSYGDLAEALDLTTAAIHYHFPSKADLGQALVGRYRRANAKTRATIWDEEDTLRERLERYVEGYVAILAACSQPTTKRSLSRSGRRCAASLPSKKTG